jgi:hypothetical protein
MEEELSKKMLGYEQKEEEEKLVFFKMEPSLKRGE